MAATKRAISRKTERKTLPKRTDATARPGSRKGSKSGRPKTTAVKKSAKSTKSASEPALLTTRQRRQLLKPRADFADILLRIEKVWTQTRAFKVPGMSGRVLKDVREKALRAIKREQLVRQQCERKMRIYADQRLLAEDAAYRAILLVYSMVKLFQPSEPEVGRRFGFIAEHLTALRSVQDPPRAVK